MDDLGVTLWKFFLTSIFIFVVSGAFLLGTERFYKNTCPDCKSANTGPVIFVTFADPRKEADGHFNEHYMDPWQHSESFSAARNQYWYCRECKHMFLSDARPGPIVRFEGVLTGSQF